jgi:alpha-galactosidase
MKYYIILALMCSTLSTLAQDYDARISGAEILTPKVGSKPKINGARLTGARPGMPFVHRIPATGVRPIQFLVKNLPKSLILNEKTGVITGRTPDKPGEYKFQIIAKNKVGKDFFEFTLVVGDKLALTPHMGWNHWYTHYLNVTDSIIRNAADEMVKSGMADVGYQYVSIDDCWMRMSPTILEDRLKNGLEF